MSRQKGLPANAFDRNVSQINENRSHEQLQAGQTLLEVILAFSISIIVLSAIILSIVSSLNNSQYTKNQSLANAYAQEGMAILKKMRDSSLSTFLNSLASGAKYCLGSNAITLSDDDKLALPYKNCIAKSPLGNPAIFGREIEITHNSESCCSSAVCPTPSSDWGSKVAIKVYWTDAKCGTGDPICHKVDLVTCFSKVDLLSAP